MMGAWAELAPEGSAGASVVVSVEDGAGVRF